MKQKILQKIPTECPWRDTLYWYDTIDSTNTQAKLLAQQGAPHGTVLIAGEQTGGRGRLGRTFESCAGMGVYLSVILRPNCAAEALMHLTCAAGAAMCEAVENVSGIRPGIKWINDLVVKKKKLGGILTELSVNPKPALWITPLWVWASIVCKRNSPANWKISPPLCPSPPATPSHRMSLRQQWWKHCTT
ncbi:MAG: biotin--[Oscillospiraceae bacterium]|nr:biotin--[acetyl-CoA-carboxylase] ligase [Oscillospiraceae bacterium]